MVATQTHLSGILSHVATGPVHAHGVLSWAYLHPRAGFPVCATPFTSLPEALNGEQAIVRERAQGFVGKLVVEILGDQMLFAPAGLYLRGGRQDRMLNASTLFPAHTALEVNVSCVEHGRWEVVHSDKFSSPDQGAVAPSIVPQGSSHVDQAAVWDTVVDFHRDLGTVSDSSSLHDAYQQSHASLEEYRSTMASDPIPGDAVGILFLQRLMDGIHAALDFFGNPELFREFLPHLQESAALSALAGRARRNEPPDVEWANLVVGSLASAALSRDDASPTAGARWAGSTTMGASVALLEYDDTLVHALLRWTKT